MKLLSIGLLGSLFVLGGCNSAKHLPREIIALPDISASIDPEAKQQMFETIATAASHLQRGDSLTIIPITGDAETELQGQTLRYVIPPAEKREAYDADLRAIGSKIKDDLARLAAEGIRHPGAHTDILGTVQTSFKTFSSGRTNKELIVMSDFVEDDAEYKFGSDHRLGTANDAVNLAMDIEDRLEPHRSVTVVMCRLRSADFGKLNVNRRRAIDAFWHQLLGPRAIDPDGIFALQEALSHVPSTK